MFGRMLFASLRARRARLGLGLLAVSLGVAVAIALGQLSIQVGDDLARTLRAAGPNFVVLPEGARLPIDLGGAEVTPARAGLALDDDAVLRMRRSFWRNHLLAAAPELSVAARLEDAPVTLFGTWFDHPLEESDGTWRAGLVTLRPHWTLKGRWPHEGVNEVVVGAGLARALALAPGRRVRIRIGEAGADRDAVAGAAGVPGGRDGSGAPVVPADSAPDSASWLVTGVLDTGGPEERHAFAPLDRVQAEAGLSHAVDRVWVSALVKAAPKTPCPDPARDPQGYERFMCSPYPENIVRDLTAAVPGAEVAMMTEAVSGEAAVVGRLNLLMLLLALASLTASTLGLLSTSTATVIERSRELGLLRAIGATPRQLATLLLGETALVGVAGGFLGWAAGALVARAIRGDVFGPAPDAAPLLLPIALVLSLGVAAFGTAGPLRMALRIDAAEALRG